MHSRYTLQYVPLRIAVYASGQNFLNQGPHTVGKSAVLLLIDYVPLRSMTRQSPPVLKFCLPIGQN